MDDSLVSMRTPTGGRWRRALADGETRWRWGVVALVVAVLIGATVAFFLGEDGRGRPTARPYADAPYYYAYAPSILLDHDVDFTDEYRVTMNWYRFGKTPIGKPGNVFGVGPALLSAPAFLAAHAVAVADGRRDGFSTVEQVAVMWVSVLLSVLALLFPYRIAARRLDARGAGLVAALLVFAAGPVVYYAVRQPGYAHPFATFFAAWLVDAWDRSFGRERTLRTWIGLGLVFGLAVLARPQLAAWGVLFGIAAADDVVRAGPRPRPLARVAGRWLAGAMVTAACLLPQLAVWKALYGAWYVVPQGSGFMWWWDPAWSEVLFSSRNGLLPWAPLYALAGLGLVAGVVRHPRLCGALLLGVALQVWINGAAWDWWAGGSFGGRRFDSTYVAFAVGLAVVLRPAVAGLAGAGALVRAGVAPVRRVRAGLAAAAGAAVLAGSLALAFANLKLCGKYDSPAARIHGGDVPGRIMRGHIHGRLGRFTELASAAANWPARALFAHRYGRGRFDYDRVVGVHFLGDTYPGLNSVLPATHVHLTVGQIPGQLRHGFVRHADGTWTIPSGRARIYVNLNRRGGLVVGLEVAHADGGQIDLRWNGRSAVASALPTSLGVIELTTRSLERGVNLLDIDAPPGTRVESMDLRALP